MGNFLIIPSTQPFQHCRFQSTCHSIPPLGALGLSSQSIISVLLVPKIVAFALLLFVSFVSPDFVKASDTQRIEEILANDTYSEDGNLLLSTTRASVVGCTVQLDLVRIGPCESASELAGVTSLINVGALRARQDQVRQQDLTGTNYESLSGAVIYTYRPIYDMLLRFANATEDRISEEERANFPNDFDIRMRVIGDRNNEEIEPNSYSMSIETIRWCSGAEVTEPMSSGNFHFYVRPDDQPEFVELIAMFAQTC